MVQTTERESVVPRGLLPGHKNFIEGETRHEGISSLWITNESNFLCYRAVGVLGNRSDIFHEKDSVQDIWKAHCFM